MTETLSTPDVGREDNLFGLGADSKTAMLVLSRLQAFYGVPIDLEASFREPTIAGLTRIVEAALWNAVQALTDEQAAAALDASAHQPEASE